EYAAHAMATQRCITQKIRQATGSTIKHISPTSLKNIFFPLPDVRDQKEIVSRIDHQRSLIQANAELWKSEIRLLQEFRTRLIVDVVSGQLDVRAIAATLPDASTISRRDITQHNDEQVMK